jgi:hypothetical protein
MTTTILLAATPANMTIRLDDHDSTDDADNGDDSKDVSAVSEYGDDCRDYDGDDAINSQEGILDLTTFTCSTSKLEHSHKSLVIASHRHRLKKRLTLSRLPLRVPNPVANHNCYDIRYTYIQRFVICDGSAQM